MNVRIISCFLVLILLCMFGCGDSEKEKEQKRLAKKYYVGKTLKCYAGKMWGSDFDCTFEITGISIEGDSMTLRLIGRRDSTDLKFLHCRDLEGEYSISEWDSCESCGCSSRTKL